jgi:hypothetical protein
VHGNPLVGVPQTDFRELDILHDESYNWADRGCHCTAALHRRALASGRSTDPSGNKESKEHK